MGADEPGMLDSAVRPVGSSTLTVNLDWEPTGAVNPGAAGEGEQERERTGNKRSRSVSSLGKRSRNAS